MILICPGCGAKEEITAARYYNKTLADIDAARDGERNDDATATQHDQGH